MLVLEHLALPLALQLFLDCTLGPHPLVSTTPGNPGILLEFVLSSWKFLCKMSMIWVPDRLFKKLVAFLSLPRPHVVHIMFLFDI